MHHDVSDEMYYQSLIRLYGRKILLCVAVVVAFSVGVELKSYYAEQRIIASQALFEEYLDNPSSQTVNTLQKQYPDAIHTQLVSLLAAKDSYDNRTYSDTEKHLAFVMNHSTDADIQTIAASRLSSMYRQLNQKDNAAKVLSKVSKHSAYSKYLEALAQPKHSEARMKRLEEAMDLNPSAYVKQLIILANYNNIGES